MLIQGTRNQLQNISNPYQGKAKKVLCLCSAGLLRSPTAAALLRESKGYNTRAAGLETSYALIPVSEALLLWSDEIVVMDEYQKSQVERHFKDLDREAKKIHVLNTPDNFGYMQETLVSIMQDRFKELDV